MQKQKEIIERFIYIYILLQLYENIEDSIRKNTKGE